MIFAVGATVQSLQVFNINKYPVLVQAWIDDGQIDAVPQESKAPIVTLPPIFRMAPGDQTSLRMITSGAPLPMNRESLFWLNLYEIPATPKDQPANSQTVTVTMRTQIKVLVRPDRLPYRAVELPKRLVFSLSKQPGKLVLTVENPTPYYASFSAIQVKSGISSQQKTPDMIAPLSSGTVEFDKLDAGVGDSAEVLFSVINDDGNAVMGKVTVATTS